MHKYLQLLFGFLLVVSCDSKMIYDQYQPIENHQWSSENKIEFIVDNTDTISKKNVFILIIIIYYLTKRKLIFFK